MSTLTKIFDWIIISSVAATFLTVIILVIKGITRTKQSAKWHYYIWFILVIRLMIPYAPNSSLSIFNTITPIVEKIPAHENSLIVETPINTEPLNRISVHSNSTEIKTATETIDIKDNKIANKFNLKNSLMLIWLLGVCVFSVYTVFINLRLSLKTRIKSTLEFSAINETLKECKKILNINRDIPIVITKDISSPSLLGFVKPILLLPKEILGKISNDELKHIILHELSHYKRKDNIVNWLVVFLKILHWFNPILWYGFYKMREDCEIACDSMAMSYMNHQEQELYGYTIVHLLKITSRERHATSTMGILSSKSGMKRRISMISLFDKKNSKFSITGLVILVALGLILLTNAKNDNKFTNKIVGANSKAYVFSDNNESAKRADSSSKGSISIFDIEGRNFRGKLMIIPNSKKIVIGYSLENSKINKTTSQIAKSENAIAAINAGYY